MTRPSRAALELERRGGLFKMVHAQYAIYRTETYFAFDAPALSLSEGLAPLRHCAPTDSESLFS